MERPVATTIEPSGATRLRALAHPLRWQLMDLLRAEGSATATRCAAATGESPASCSYHLNLLEKYGFVCPAEGGQGRQRPWKLVDPATSFGAGGLRLDGEPGSTAAGEAFLEHTYRQQRANLAATAAESDEWKRVSGFNGLLSHLTAEEAGRMRQEIDELFDRYRHRAEDPAAQPTGARPVRFILSCFVMPEPDPETT